MLDNPHAVLILAYIYGKALRLPASPMHQGDCELLSPGSSRFLDKRVGGHGCGWGKRKLVQPAQVRTKNNSIYKWLRSVLHVRSPSRSSLFSLLSCHGAFIFPSETTILLLFCTRVNLGLLSKGTNRLRISVDKLQRTFRPTKEEATGNEDNYIWGASLRSSSANITGNNKSRRLGWPQCDFKFPHILYGKNNVRYRGIVCMIILKMIRKKQ